MNKAVQVLNRFSVLLFSAIFLLVYAYLPISVNLEIEGMGQLHKQTFFYYLFGTFLGINIIMRVALHLGLRGVEDDTSAWIRSIIFVINFFLTTLVGFIGVLNNSTHISPGNYAYLNYLGPVFLVIWAIGLIFLLISKKNQAPQPQ